METMAYKTDEKARGKRTISKLRAKVDPSHPNYMGEAWLSTPDGQAALRRIAAYDPGQATPGRSTVAAKLAIRKQLDSIKAIGEATKDTTDELLTRAQGKIPQKRPDQTAAERKREIDAALANVPAMRAERKQMAALEAAERKAAGVGKRRRTERDSDNRASLKKKCVHDLRDLCGELAVEANGTKAQMIERIVAARTAPGERRAARRSVDRGARRAASSCGSSERHSGRRSVGRRACCRSRRASTSG